MSATLILRPVVRGNDYAGLHPITGLSPGATLVSGTCVVKATPESPSPVSGIAVKTLTTTYTPGVGQLINPGAVVPPNTGGFTSPAARTYTLFLLTPAETALLVGTEPYTVIVEVTDSYGFTYTTEVSSLPVSPGVAG